jgi:hypothetical protein
MTVNYRVGSINSGTDGEKDCCILAICVSIYHGKQGKAKQLTVLSLLRLKQVSDFLKNDDDNDDKVCKW